MRTFTSILLICCLPLLIIGSSLEEFSSRQRTFAASLFQEVLNTTDRNVFFSPLSVEIILALIQNGAKGETAEELMKVLNFTKSSSKLVKNVLEELEAENYYTLHTANKVYVANGIPLAENFKSLAKNAFHAGLENIDFGDNYAAAKIINEWVENQTANKIKNLIKPDVLSSNTIAVLINALYFKASWYNAFIPRLTQQRRFYTKGSSFVLTNLMNQEWISEKLQFSSNTKLDATFLKIPFDAEDAKIVIVLPNQLDGITILEQNINEVLAPQLYTKKNVVLSLPKFKIETETTLNSILEKVGITKIFDSAEADLSGLAGRKGEVAISSIVQKGFIEVDEKGVEAAVATYATVDRIMGGKPDTIFKVDHPFIFYIEVKNVILFTGKVVNPNV